MLSGNGDVCGSEFGEKTIREPARLGLSEWDFGSDMLFPVDSKVMNHGSVGS
jgi:hypothetical protein